MAPHFSADSIHESVSFRAKGGQSPITSRNLLGSPIRVRTSCCAPNHPQAGESAAPKALFRSSECTIKVKSVSNTCMWPTAYA